MNIHNTTKPKKKKAPRRIGTLGTLLRTIKIFFRFRKHVIRGVFVSNTARFFYFFTHFIFSSLIPVFFGHST